MLTHDSLPFPVKISGNVDRIDIRNGVTRIIDYKTGRVNVANLKLKTWEDLIDPKNDKIIHVLAYAFMYCKDNDPGQITAGILSFKNMKAGFMPFVFEHSKIREENIAPETLDHFTAAIAGLLSEILNQDVPFAEKEVRFS